jgi:hypothetical protein
MREVIRLMAHLIYTGDEDIYRPGISRTIYDPACRMGGMLSVSEAYIREYNNKAHLTLFGEFRLRPRPEALLVAMKNPLRAIRCTPNTGIGSPAARILSLLETVTRRPQLTINRVRAH